MHEILSHGRSCLVGKLFSAWIIEKDAIKSTLIRGWRPSGSAVFKVVGENLFLVEFENAWDMSRVLKGRPWIFEGNLFSVEDFHGDVPPV